MEPTPDLGNPSRISFFFFYPTNGRKIIGGNERNKKLCTKSESGERNKN